jgi:hypothetical protein
VSWAASGWAKQCRLGSPVRKVVLLVLADYATDDARQAGVAIPHGWAVAWPAVSTIAEDAEVSRATAYATLGWLAEHAVIGREQRFDASGRQKTSGYWIEWGRMPLDLGGVPSDGLDGEGPVAGREGLAAGPSGVRGAGPKPSRGTVTPTHITTTTTPDGYVTTAGGAQVFHNPESSSGSAGAAASPAAPSDEIRARALGSSRGRRRA